MPESGLDLRMQNASSGLLSLPCGEEGQLASFPPPSTLYMNAHEPEKQKETEVSVSK